MRCEGDPSTSDSPPCSRCRRLKIPCVYLAPFKRTHKRKRLQELEEETTELKRKLLSASPGAPSTHPLNADGLLPHHKESIDVSSISTARVPQRDQASATRDPTLPRNIDGLELTSSMIDDCFEIYFKDYHFMLPILDPSITPNVFYQHAPFLFWLIVSVGSRRYTRQPSLSQALALPVTQLALQSIIARTKPTERMKGLIVLLTWPFPSTPFFRDSSFLLCGALLHMAMQCGLHTPMHSEDFSKTTLKLPEEEPLRRAELWAYIVITYQRTCSGSGQPALISFEILNEQVHVKSLLERLPLSLRIQLLVTNIITRAQKTFLDLGLLSMTPQQERAMDALLMGFATELDNLETLTSSVWDRFYIACARQDLAALHFYKSAIALDVQCCISIYNATSSVLEYLGDLDRDYGLHHVSTRFLITVTVVSLTNMARVLKGPFAGYLDRIRGHELYDIGVLFLRSSSVQKADFPERSAVFAEQLWKSKKVFRDPDGSVNITLRVRNRLSSGSLHDVIRCWREEFLDPDYMHSATSMDAGTMMPSNTSAGLDSTLAPNPNARGTLSGSSAALEPMLSDDLWGDLALGMSDDWDIFESSMNWMA